ncbi:MAG: endopeptidase La, partial [Alishewanella sp. 32-51-5]
MTTEHQETLHMPVLALRDVVVYPHMVIPLFVGRAKSIKCLDAAMDNDKQIFLVAQKDATLDDPTEKDLYQIGTVATILQLLKLPDGTVKVLVEGGKRAKLSKFTETKDSFAAFVELVPTQDIDSREQEVFLRSAINQFEGYIKLNKKIPPEVLTALSGIDDAARLADTMAAHMPLKVED